MLLNLFIESEKMYVSEIRVKLWMKECRKVVLANFSSTFPLK